jgi:hypothetical protein
MAQVIQLPSGRSRPADEVLGPIKEKVEQAKRDRKRLEPTIHSNRAFAAGKQWLKWSRGDRRLMLDPKDVEGARERTTVDLLSQYMGTGEGLLAGAEARRDLVFRKEDIRSEDFTKAANDAMAFGWEVEFNAVSALARTKRRILVDGTAAIRVRFDPTVGRDLGEVPIGDGRTVTVLGEQEGEEPRPVPTQAGQPILDGSLARAYMAELMRYGEQPKMRRLNEGRVILEPLSFFNLLVPPGIEDEDLFPWEAVIDAVSIDRLIAEYGDKAEGIEEEPLAALEMLGAKESLDSSLGASPEDADTPGKLDGHVMRIKFYERPCREYPKGRTVCFAGERLLAETEELPLKRPNGDYTSGVVYFHYKPVEGRFFGRSLVEQGKSPQRVFNQRVSQIKETIDRGQPYVLVADNQDDEGLKQSTIPLELVKVPPTGMVPQPVQGMGPGEWMWRSLEELRQELEEAMGIKGVELGENPQNVNTYGQLQLLAEKAKTKTNPIVEDFQAGVERIEECCVYLMRKYWPSDKVIAIVGEEDMAEAVEFKASQLPEFFRFKVADAARSRSQAAEIQLITDVWNAAQPLIANDPDPEVKHRWLAWYVDSLKAGKMLPLPDSPADAQYEKARWQNSQLADGEPVEAAPWDNPEVHLPEHNELRTELEMAGRDELVQLVSEHIAEDEAIAQAAQEAEAQAQAQQAAEADAQQQAAAQEAQAASDANAEAERQNKLQVEALRAAGR